VTIWQRIICQRIFTTLIGSNNSLPKDTQLQLIRYNFGCIKKANYRPNIYKSFNSSYRQQTEQENHKLPKDSDVRTVQHKYNIG